MSRTRKGSKPCGMEFGKRYRCDKYWRAGIGAYAKWKANMERRIDSKNLSRRVEDA